MGYLKYVKEAWKRPKSTLGTLVRQRLIQWRKDPATLRIKRPTRIDRARSLGYKAKQGIILVRQRVPKSNRMRPRPVGGRRSKHARRKKIVDKSYRQIAEERANKKFVNCEVLNSYWVASDGKHHWYEIILVDKYHPAILKDKNLMWVSNPKHSKRVFRGLTSAGRKSRGLRNKGKGAEKAR